MSKAWLKWLKWASEATSYAANSTPPLGSPTFDTLHSAERPEAGANTAAQCLLAKC